VIELGLRDRLVADDCDVVCADALTLTTAAGRERSSSERDGKDGEETGVFHKKERHLQRI